MIVASAHRHHSFLPCLLLLFFSSLVQSQVCNTLQNPSCAGVAAFEALCCPAPSVCYWRRDGSGACCSAGQDCRADGGPNIVTVPNQIISYPYTTVTSTYQVVNPTTTTYQVVAPPATTITQVLVAPTTQQAVVTPTTQQAVATSVHPQTQFTITTTVSGVIAVLNEAPAVLPHIGLIALEVFAAVLGII